MDEHSSDEKSLGDQNKDESESDSGMANENDDNKDSGFGDESARDENVKDLLPESEMKKGEFCSYQNLYSCEILHLRKALQASQEAFSHLPCNYKHFQKELRQSWY